MPGIFFRRGVTAGILCMCLGLVMPVYAAEPESESILSSVGEAQIQPVGDEAETYLLKSEGFYCLKEDGTKHAEPAVHYFDHMEIDRTVLNGFYYHDESGYFAAGNPHIVQISGLTCMVPGNDGTKTEAGFDGLYMANNLGKLTAAPQVRYITGLTVDKISYEGYYFFDENGRMITAPGYHEIEMTSNGQKFSGIYYFGGENGVLIQDEGTTPEGFPVDNTGRVSDIEYLGMDTLKPRLESMLTEYDGVWSVYVKNLNTGEEILLNETPLYSASLIKAFVMANTYDNMEDVLTHQETLMKGDRAAAEKKVDDLLWNMITVSDNESCNELGRLQSEKHDFLDGAERVNEYLKKEGYENTSYQSTLHPSSSPKLNLGGHNTTTVKDCGILLEKIFRGECVSEEASAEMLDLLMNQKNTAKIPSGISADIPIANKTGETDSDQHDMAIVYGPKTTYILCVMSEDFKSGSEAIDNIRSISGVVYNYLNLS